MTSDERPPTEYGEWVRGNAGQVGRCVTAWVPSSFGGWMPVVDWEPHPDELGTQVDLDTEADV